MGKSTPAKRAASRRHLALRKRKARAKATVASGFHDLVAFFQSPVGERFVILEIFILIAMTLLIYILYQKEMQKREELQEAMHMIRTFVVGMEPFYVDKDDFQILAVAQNISEEMRYYSQKNEELQKEIDILTRNLNDGWVLYSRAFYFFSLELNTWMDSKKKCEKEGAHLISMETKEEQYFINKQVKHRKMIFWIGVFKDKGKKWSWLSGMEAAVHYWNYHEPSYKENHNCGAMVFDCYYENCWNALDCDLQIPYICKKGPDDAWL